MRARLTAGLMTLIWLPVLAQGQTSARTDEELLAQADAAFKKGIENKARLTQSRKHFAQAADAYLVLHQRGMRSPALYRNLGNAAVLADRWPIAVWAYTLGLKLDPNDAAMREQLAFVRGKVIYASKGQGRPEPDSGPAWLHRPTMDELAGVSILSYVLAWLIGACAFLTRRPRLVLLTGILVLLTLAAGVGWWRAREQAEYDRTTPLVVLMDNVDFHRGNAATYPKHADVPLLPRGLEARQLHRRGGWLQIRLSTGEVGWVPRNQVLVVEP